MNFKRLLKTSFLALEQSLWEILKECLKPIILYYTILNEVEVPISSSDTILFPIANFRMTFEHAMKVCLFIRGM